jgi:hypothetical protein
MKIYFDVHPFTHYIPLDGHNITLRKVKVNENKFSAKVA